MDFKSACERVLVLAADERTRRFALLSAAFVSFTTFSSYLEEKIFKALPGFEYAWAVALVELIVFAVWSMIQRCRKDGFRNTFMQHTAPLWMYFAFAVCLAFSTSLAKVTYLYMNYATGTVVKSTRLVPTLALSVCWLRRPVSKLEWFAAGLLTASSCFMALGEKLSDINFKPFGLAVASVQLCAAALQGNLQERVLKDFDASVPEAMFFGNAFGAAVVLAIMSLNGELLQVNDYFQKSPYSLILLVFRSLTFFVGAVALNTLTKEYGIGAATVIGTARKTCTLILSFTIFPKPFHINYVFGVSCFLGADAIYFIRSSEKAAQRAQKPEYQLAGKEDTHSENDDDTQAINMSEMGTASASEPTTVGRTEESPDGIVVQSNAEDQI